MIISGNTALAAGASNNNIFAGTYIEIMPADGVLQFGFTTGDLAGITLADIEVDVMCGMELIANNYNPRALGATPQMPIFPDDFLLSCPALEGTRIIGKVRNLDAANAAVLHWSVVFDPA